MSLEESLYETNFRKAKDSFREHLDKKYNLRWVIFKSGEDYLNREEQADREMDRFIEAYESGKDWARSWGK